jgi:hypothetical protein
MYISIIGDIIGSRKIEPERRKRIQKLIEDILSEINESKEYSDYVVSKFTLTEGDEFQGLLMDNTNPHSIIRFIQVRLEEGVRFRFGIGYGKLTTEIKPISIGMDGECWHNSRDAIMIAKRNDLTSYLIGEKELEIIINLLFDNFYSFYWKFTEKQRDVYDLYYFWKKDIEEIKSQFEYSSVESVYQKLRNWKLISAHKNELAINDIFQSKDLSLNSYTELLN